MRSDRSRPPPGAQLGAKDCTPEFDTLEIIMDFQWHFPMDVQWHFPTDVQWHFPKDCHLSSGFVLELSTGFQWPFPIELPCLISGV